MKLDSHTQVDLDRRKAIGVECLRAADPNCMEDSETAAKDAISDILTALYGPYGGYTYGGAFVLNKHGASDHARGLLDSALESYQGDAEDYSIVPGPGEYGYGEVS